MALITKDRMRVDVEAEFYVRVRPEKKAVSMAASTLGRRTLEAANLHGLLSGKFESAMRAVAAEMDMERCTRTGTPMSTGCGRSRRRT